MQRKDEKLKGSTRFLALCARVSRLENNISKIHAYLGINPPLIPTGKKEIEKLHQEALQLAENKTIPAGVNIQKWLILFSEISYTYLALVHDHTGDRTPWSPYLKITYLIDDALKEKPELRMYANFAKKNLQNAVFSAALFLNEDTPVSAPAPEKNFCDRVAKTLFCLWDLEPTTGSKDSTID